MYPSSFVCVVALFVCKPVFGSFVPTYLYVEASRPLLVCLQCAHLVKFDIMKLERTNATFCVALFACGIVLSFRPFPKTVFRSSASASRYRIAFLVADTPPLRLSCWYSFCASSPGPPPYTRRKKPNPSHMELPFFLFLGGADGNDANLRSEAVEAMNVLIKNSARDMVVVVRSTLEVVLSHLEQSFGAQILTAEDRDRVQGLQSLLCGSLQVSKPRLFSTLRVSRFQDQYRSVEGSITPPCIEIGLEKVGCLSLRRVVQGATGQPDRLYVGHGRKLGGIRTVSPTVCAGYTAGLGHLPIHSLSWSVEGSLCTLYHTL